MLVAQEINLNEVFPSNSKSKVADSQDITQMLSSKQKNISGQSNKYNRNVLLVMESVLTGAYKILFTGEEL